MGLEFGIEAEDCVNTYYSAQSKIINHFYCKADILFFILSFVNVKRG